MNVDLINTVMKAFLLVIFTNIISIKMLDNKLKIKYIFIIILESLILSATYIMIKQHIDSKIALSIIYILICFYYKILNKYKMSYSMLIIFIAIAIYAITFGFAVLLSFIPHKILNIENYIANSILLQTIQGILIIIFFKIKKFRRGFAFLKEQEKNDYIDMSMCLISAIILLIYCLLGNYYEDKLTKRIFISLIAIGIIMIITIKKILNLCYKQSLLKRELENYKKNLEEKDKEIEKLSKEKYEISRINHEFYNRQRVLELKVKNLGVEAGEELGILDRINDLSKEYSENLEEIKGISKLPVTNIPEIDDMFKYMQAECVKNKIDFKLHINGNTNHLVNEIIPKNKLETLIGDHIRNAIIAINFSKNKNRSILVMLGTKENCYELSIYDSGIEFEIETLKKLGLERATTHKETGGSGIGFMTTFKTLKECKASLIIEEKHGESENDYTKAIKIKFDGKSEYKVISYRATELKEKIKSDRISIEEK